MLVCGRPTLHTTLQAELDSTVRFVTQGRRAVIRSPTGPHSINAVKRCFHTPASTAGHSWTCSPLTRFPPRLWDTSGLHPLFPCCSVLDLTPSPCPLRSSRVPSADVLAPLTRVLSLPASRYLWPQRNDSDSCLDACKVSGLGPSPLQTYLNLFSPQKKPTRQVLLSPILQTGKLRFSEVKGPYVLL